MDAYKHAKAIVQRLKIEGYIAYFAGGWVRDYVMGHPSEDIDIATSASPSQIMDLFPDTILVGLAFGVVIVAVAGHQFEVATFRRDLTYEDGRRPTGIEPSEPMEDALRRDFTINGMFYDPLEDVIHDFVGGRRDIERGVVRTIGDPHERFFEDRLRMLRAFRFSARFGFFIERETQDAIREHADTLLPAVAMERVRQELNKMAGYPRYDLALIEMHQLNLLEVIFPELKDVHLNELRRLVSAFQYFPLGTPPILYLMQLFPSLPLLAKIEICNRIKGTNKEIKLVEFAAGLSSAVSDDECGLPVDDYRWVRLYAHPDSQICLEVHAAGLDPDGRNLFLNRHSNRLQKLAMPINRVRECRPLVSAALLQKEGISPGVHMGFLLKEAERLAIRYGDETADEIVVRLKQTPFWSKNNE